MTHQLACAFRQLAQYVMNPSGIEETGLADSVEVCGASEACLGQPLLEAPGQSGDTTPHEILLENRGACRARRGAGAAEPPPCQHMEKAGRLLQRTPHTRDGELLQ